MAQVGDTGTLAELDVKPGDVVEALEIGSFMVDEGKYYAIRDDGKFLTEGGELFPVAHMAHTFRIISRS